MGSMALGVDREFPGFGRGAIALPRFVWVNCPEIRSKNSALRRFNWFSWGESLIFCN